MSSFTDQPIKYNPYISTTPVQAMVSVGIQKEQEFKVGIQKAQSYIDSIAGLDILKDSDRNYLSSKMGQIKEGINKSLSGDFSDERVLNQIAGAATSVYRDPNIQTAVISTAAVRKGYADMEEAKKAGKSNISNEYIYNRDVQSWMDDGKIGSSFNGKYIPYTDVTKKLQEIAKSIGEDESIIQNLFQTDANGNPILINGKLQYNDVMAEQTLKGKDKNKILTAFQNGLNADDYRQLGFDGIYSLRGVDRLKLLGNLKDNFKEYEKNALAETSHLQDTILQLQRKGASSEEINKIKNQISTIESSINRRKKSLQDYENMDDDALRGSLYSSNYLDSMSYAFSTTTSALKYTKNPAVEIFLEKERLKLANQTEARAWAEFNYKKQHDIQQMSFERWKALYTKGEIDKDGNPTSTFTGSFYERGLKPTDSETYYTDLNEQALSTEMDMQGALYEKVAIAHWKAANAAKGKNFSDMEIRQSMNDWAKKLGLSYNDYVVTQANKAKIDYESKNPTLGPEFKEDFRQISDLEKRIAIRRKAFEGESKAVAEAAKAEKFTPTDVKIENINPVKLSFLQGGGEYGPMVTKESTLSKQDIENVAWLLYHQDLGAVPRFLDSKTVKDRAAKAEAALIAKYGPAGVISLKEQLGPKNIFSGDVGEVFSSLTGIEYKPNSEVQKALKFITDLNYKKTRQAKENYWKANSDVYVPISKPLYADKPEAQKHLHTSINTIAAGYGEGGLEEYKPFAEHALKGDADFRININPPATPYGENTYELEMTVKDGGKVTSKPITALDYKFLTGEKAPSAQEAVLKKAIQAYSTGSTNSMFDYHNPNEAYKGAFYSAASISDFKNVKDHTIAIDFTMNNGMYWPKYYIKQNNEWVLREGGVPLTAEQAAYLPSQINDIFVKSLLNPPNK